MQNNVDFLTLLSQQFLSASSHHSFRHHSSVSHSHSLASGLLQHIGVAQCLSNAPQGRTNKKWIHPHKYDPKEHINSYDDH
jgi:hypothetical protein